METLLYSLSFNYIDALYWAIPPMLALALHSAAQALHAPAKNRRKTRSVLFLRLGAAALMLVFIIGFGGHVLRYRELERRYHSGDVSSVSGYVEDFHPMSITGHERESFRLGSTEFSYSDYALVHGYHRSASNGGVITGNGQHIRIDYIESEEAPIIVGIRELP